MAVVLVRAGIFCRPKVRLGAVVPLDGNVLVDALHSFGVNVRCVKQQLHTVMIKPLPNAT